MWYDPQFAPAHWVPMLHGGTDDAGQTLSDIWIYDNGWIPLPNALGPARSEHDIVFDDTTDSLFLIGGRDASGGVPATASTWRFDGQDWRELPTATRPPATIGAAVVMDPVRRSVVLAGGATDAQGAQVQPAHWEFAPGIVTESFGAACSYWPRTAQIAAGICRRGEQWEGHVWVNNAQNLAWSLFVFGLSNSSWNGVPLPMSLGVLGIPNCDLLVEPLVTQVAAIEPPGT